mmetsp:Transcript_17417/g.44819  ORF Transcript_17417/g.44819 Transcript_17417/m.44819 type:complete len:203 (+) Transcript_17417:1285-1893(+)
MPLWRAWEVLHQEVVEHDLWATWWFRLTVLIKRACFCGRGKLRLAGAPEGDDHLPGSRNCSLRTPLHLWHLERDDELPEEAQLAREEAAQEAPLLSLVVEQVVLIAQFCRRGRRLTQHACPEGARAVIKVHAVGLHRHLQHLQLCTAVRQRSARDKAARLQLEGNRLHARKAPRLHSCTEGREVCAGSPRTPQAKARHVAKL